MVFSSLIFMYVFLPAVVLLYFLMPNLKLKNLVLLIASLIFYAWGEPLGILLLLFTAAVNYYLSLAVERSRGKRGAKNALILAIVIDLALLGFFKYLGFFVENINFITHLQIPVPNIKLPLGISFYTFQILSYVVDVYWDKVKPASKLTDFMLYVALFPQLIAGPIVRYIDVDEEIKRRKTTLPLFAQGATRFLIGLGKKVLLANTVGGIATQLLDSNPGELSVLGGWVGIILFALQIYFDFSGYSDMAIGLGKIFGFNYLENFNFPYISTSITDFWRRWHMSLSTFFRDYVYIPMGGNRRHQYFNILVVWFLTGMWHGASWNFILWGLYFCVVLILEKSFLLKLLKRLPKIVGHIYALFMILMGWVFFYFTDLDKCFYTFKLLFGGAGVSFTDPTTLLLLRSNLILIVVAILACLPISHWVRGRCSRIIRRSHHGQAEVFALNLAFNLVLLFLATSSLVGSSFNPFIYFRF